MLIAVVTSYMNSSIKQGVNHEKEYSSCIIATVNSLWWPVLGPPSHCQLACSHSSIGHCIGHCSWFMDWVPEISAGTQVPQQPDRGEWSMESNPSRGHQWTLWSCQMCMVSHRSTQLSCSAMHITLPLVGVLAKADIVVITTSRWFV